MDTSMEFSILPNISEETQRYSEVYNRQFGTYNISIFNTTFYSYPASHKTLMFITQNVTPYVFAVGMFFNIFVGLILRNTEFKKVTPFVYILALCIIDSVYLMAKIIPIRLYNVYVVPGVCQIIYYMSFLSIFMEWWIMVMLISERCFSLYSSRKAGKLCSAFRTKCAIITMSLLSIVSHLYHTWTSVVIETNDGKVCMVIPEFFQYLTILRKLDVIFAFCIPFSLIMIMKTVIIVQLCRRKRSRKRDIRQFVATTTTVAKRPVTLCVDDRGKGRSTLGGLNLRMVLSKRQITTKIMLIIIVKVALCLPHDVLKAKLTFLNDASDNERIILLFLDELYVLNFSVKGIMCLLLFPCFRKCTVHYLKTMVASCCQRLLIRDH